MRTFKRYFEVVRASNDQPTIQNPFFHLSGDGFWTLVPSLGQAPIYRPGTTSGAPSVTELRRRVAHGKFDDGFWPLLSDQVSRHQLREALIARYFPEKREELAALVVQGGVGQAADALRQELPPTPARDAAFRRIILEIYDATCCACGVRVRLDSEHSLVEAAHIIPFSESHIDKPTNGLALCPNHHWAMDRYLIAPCPNRVRREGVWKVSSRLEQRKSSERDLVALAGKPVIPRSEAKFYPALESLRWREEHLAATH